MNTDNGTLSFATGIDTSGFERGVSRLEGMISGAGSRIAGELGNVTDMSVTLEGAMKRLGAALGIGFSVKQAWDFVAAVRDVRSEIQSLEISFETLLGSKDKADALFGSIRQFAVNTPMQLKDLASAAQMMLSFNIEESKIMPYLQAIGDVSMGDTQKFQGLALAFSQMSSAGKLMGQDLMQMINAGFNPLAVMAEKTGKSIAELKDEMSAGKISAEMVQQAFMDATGAGGKFYGMLEKQSKGIAGAMSNLQGAIDDMFNELGEKSEGVIAGMYTMGTEVVKNWKAVAEAIGVAITAFGMYKAATMASVAIDSTVTGVQYTAEKEQLAQVIAMKEAEANADIQEAVASGRVSAARAQSVIAARAEAQAVVQTLQAKAEEAEMDLANAIAAQKSSQKRLFVAVENVKAAQMELAAARERGTVFDVTIAKEKLETAQTELNTAQKQANAATTEVLSRKKIADATSTTAETAATQLNTAAETGNAAATSFLAAAKTALMATVRRLYAAISAHPYAIVAAAVAALAYGIYKLCTAQSEAEKAQRRLDDATRECSQSIAAEQTKISYLFSRLKNAKEGTEEYKNAKDAILSQYGSYLQGLSAEIATLKDVEGAYNAVAEAARRSARERAIAKAMDAEADELARRQAEIKDKIYKWAKKQYGESKLAGGRLKADDVYWQIANALDDPSKKISESFLKKFDVLSTSANGAAGTVTAYTNNVLRSYIAQYNEAGKVFDNSVKEAGRRFGKLPEAGTDPTDKTEPIKNNSYWENIKKEAEAEWKALDDAELKSEKALEIRKKFDEADRHLKERSLETSRNSGKSQSQLLYEADATSEKLTSVERRQARDRKRMQEDMEEEIWQARIDSGAYGSQSYIQQRDLDFQKEQRQLQRQMEDAIDAEVARQKEIWDKQEELTEKEAKAKGKNYTRKAFNSDSLSGMEFKPGDTFEDEKIGDVDMANIYAISQQYAQLQKLMSDTQEKTRQEEVKRQNQAMNEYLAQWGEYTQKRQALIDIANAKLNDTNANLTEGERKSIAAQLTKDLADLDMEASKTTNAISVLFRDMAGKTVSDLRKMASEGQKALDLLKAKEYDKEQGDALGITKEMWETLKKSPDELEKITKAIKDMSKEADSLGTPIDKITKGFDDLFNSDGDKEKLKKALSELKQGLGELFAAVSVVSGALSSLGDAFGSGVLSGIADGLNTAMEAVNGALSGAQAGAVFGPWGAAAGAAIGLVGSLGSAIARMIDKGHERKIQKLQEQIEALDKSYSALEKEIEKAYSKDASDLIEQNNKLLEQKKTLIRQQMAEEEAKKKTDKDRLKEWQEQIDAIDEAIADGKQKAVDAIFGEDLKTAIENFATAYAEAWQQGESRAKSAKDTVREMMRKMVTASIEAAIQSSDAMEKIREQLRLFYTDDILEPWEQRYVLQMAEELQKQLDEQFGWADSLMSGSQYEQSGSNGGFQTMSEETGAELNGRFTALQISSERSAGLLEAIQLDTETIKWGLSGLGEGMTELQNINLLQLEQLEIISGNTRHLQDMAERLEQIERNTKNL